MPSSCFCGSSRNRFPGAHNKKSLSLRLAIPTAVGFLLFLWLARTRDSVDFTIPIQTVEDDPTTLGLQPVTSIPTAAKRNQATSNPSKDGGGEIFSRFKHFSPQETIKILTDLGDHDKYDGSALRCNTNNTHPRQPELYWYDYPSMTRPDSQKPARRLLIIQSAGFGSYAQLLDLTAPINKAYARKWGQTLLILQGTLVVLDQEKKTNCTPPEHRSTHNKMQLLKFALQLQDHYDYLLLLDADAMIYDFSIDLSSLMPPRAMMAANRVIAKKGVKKRATWKINAGVTLWNLHHRYTAAVAKGWTDAAVGFMNGRNNNPGDQLFLYHVLKNNASFEEQVYSFGKEFYYNKATVIKHIKRPQVTYEIGQTALDSRSTVIAQFVQEICTKFPSDCIHLDNTTYSGSSNT